MSSTVRSSPSKRQAARPRRRWVPWVVALLAFFAGLVGSWGYRVVKSLGGKDGSIVKTWVGLTNPRALFPGQSTITILVVGKDYNHDRRGIAYTRDARSDTIMILAADLNAGKLAAVNIPRDTKVTAPDGITGKINAVFQRGGLPLLQSTLATEFGVQTDYHVVLKADAVREIVNAVGGVTVEAVDDMFYEDSWGDLKINIPAGINRLTGEQAVGFVRFRKMGTHRIGPNGEKIRVRYRSSKEEGDIRRTERQQALVRALVAEATRPTNLWKADQIIDVGFNQVETNLERTQLVALATIFKSGAAKNMPSATIPGSDSMEGGAYYYIPDRDRAYLTIDWLIRGNEAAGRKMIRVAVYNSTRKAGLARDKAAEFEAMGFTAFSGGNSRERPEATEVLYRKASHAAFAQEIAKAVGATVVKKDTDADPRADWLPEVKVILAEDALASPSPSPTPVASAGY